MWSKFEKKVKVFVQKIVHKEVIFMRKTHGFAMGIAFSQVFWHESVPWRGGSKRHLTVLEATGTLWSKWTQTWSSLF